MTTTPFDAQILKARVSFVHQPFVRPLILSTGAIEAITQADAYVRVRLPGSNVEVEGAGCMYLSDLWAWPDPAFTHDQRDAAMRAYCEHLAAELPKRFGAAAHPLRLGLQLHDYVAHEQSENVIEGPLPPVLARSVCACIFDAAIHDAVGRAVNRSAFDLYDQPFDAPEADAFFTGGQGASRAIQQLLQTPARTTSPAWWIVGKADDLEKDVRPVADEKGFFAFKIKIMGREAEVDAARVAEVYQACKRWGIEQPRITIDSNEANPDAASVMSFLDILAERDPAAYAALEMVEQPTGRDIAKFPFDWSAVGARKPVMVDEGLMTLDSMPLSQSQHWSGFALKTCKGHSFALTAAAWAHQNNMLLSLQDLTNPGLAAVHAALFAARVPTLNGVELNTMQFTPAANGRWVNIHPGLFHIQNGLHQLPDAKTPGLGGGA